MIVHSLQAFADPEIASRTATALVGAAVAGTVVGVTWIALPRQNRWRGVLVPAMQSGFVYLLLGLGSRLVVQHHRSRLQIVVLLGAVACAELLRHRRETAPLPRLASWFAGSVAVCLGVVAAKWALEPGALSETLNHLRAADGNA